MATKEPYYSVSTLVVKPENVNKERKSRVSKATEELEPAAETYRWYKVEGRDEFVYIEKFASEEAYCAHQNSSHVQGLYKEYLQYITEPFIFYPIYTSKDKLVGGSERA
ncbi:hypothetical protein VM1G_11589 [Cytospora mali]|uniref:ABM domain-containing protein n=1 Tax=Cytospora mali TaxID=578113 RepID=A0A194VYB3_CYTMA|nr:hypothetical protein VM1G_11589 [Valsa mali]